jgi:hypothetical protein
MRHRFAALLALLALALAITGSAMAFDCIRVSSSLQGLQQSTKSGYWLLFDLSSQEGVQQTFENVFEAQLSDEDAECLATAYAQSGQPLYFALGIGVAGGKKETFPAHGARAAGEGFGVIAWHANEVVLGDGNGIDHIEDGGIVPALFGAAQGCGITLPDEE